MKLTRRQLATVLAPAAAVAGAAAHSAPAVDDELRAARERVKTNGEALAGHTLPMSVEPAFQFKA
ncbi:MAG: hypothetical protein ACLQKA_24020 [Bryobacteraceae bacterium]